MKNTFKKMSIFAATVLMGLVGCGKTDNPTTSLNPTTANPTTAAPTPTTTAPEPTTPTPEPSTSTPTPTTPTPDNVDIDVRLEAENGSLGATNLSIKENELASEGKYIGG